MSGHSKWSTIKRDKAVNDSKRSQVFTKVSKLITSTAKKGGGDPDSNPSLRFAIEKAKEARMPKENIERAVAKGTGEGTGVNLEEVIYEGYGPSGVAILVKAITDNKNRTVAEIRNIFSKNGGNLAESGAAQYIFTPDPENPLFEIPFPDENKAKTVLLLVEELDNHEDVQEVYANFVISGN